jgi:hypothetical protein
MLANGYTITALFLIAPKGWEYLNYFVMNWQGTDSAFCAVLGENDKTPGNGSEIIDNLKDRCANEIFKRIGMLWL